MSSNALDPLVAIGVLSTAGAAGKTSATDPLRRRLAMRESWHHRASSAVIQRFILANSGADNAVIHDEQRRFGDIIFTNRSESRFACAWKFVEWFTIASSLFSRVRFFGVADDDSYIDVYPPPTHTPYPSHHLAALGQPITICLRSTTILKPTFER